MNPINKIALGVGAAVALAIGIAFVWLLLANAHLKTRLAEAQVYGAACHLANDEFYAKTVRQNKAVEQLKASGILREKKARGAAQAAQEAARKYFAAAESLRKARPHGDGCKAAETFINAYLEGDK